jgi:ATP-binding cassette subfamily B protein RaxB
MQEDQLLSGSIADNICFFEATFDLQGMIECARVAGIHDSVMAMPMSYNSLIGDMGSSLSSGQKQRVLLARALYRRPKILFLDEGTAHLDTEKEKEISANLRHLNMTRVSVAHRPEITNGADMIFHLAAAAGRLQVSTTSRGPVAAPAGDASPSGFGPEGAKSAETAQDHDSSFDDCSNGDRKAGYLRDKHGWKDAKNGGSEPQPQKDCCGSAPPNDCSKVDGYCNPGEALATIDFSRW